MHDQSIELQKMDIFKSRLQPFRKKKVPFYGFAIGLTEPFLFWTDAK